VAFHERRGEIAVRWLPIDNQARLDMAALEAACYDGVDLVCVMAANNEVGTLYPVEAVARIAAQAGARTLIDTTQAAGRIPMQAAAWGITYLTVSAHKIYGPKGVGALVVPRNWTYDHPVDPCRAWAMGRRMSQVLRASVMRTDSGALRWQTTSPAWPPSATG
jgi:cysteine desulfurase